MAFFNSLFGKKQKETAHPAQETQSGSKAEEPKKTNPGEEAPVSPAVETEPEMPYNLVLTDVKDPQNRAIIQTMLAQKTAALLLAIYAKQPGGYMKDDEGAAPVRRIGTRLNEMGGMDLMRKNASEVCGRL